MVKMNPEDNPIEIKCQGADRLPLDAMIEFQGELKKLSTKNRDKLMASICLKGFIAPIFIWENAGDNFLLDGHQRLKTLIHMRIQGWDIPLIPVVFIEADDEQDAREKLAVITSQYGEFDMTELNNWIENFDNELLESMRLVDEELAFFIPDFQPTSGEDQGQLDELSPKLVTCPNCGEEFDAR